MRTTESLRRECLKKTSTAVIILTFTAACGREKTQIAGPDPLPTTPPVCRNYATAMNVTGSTPSATTTSSVSCSFDRAALTLTCGPQTQTYASVADFVEEAQAVGRVRVLRDEASSDRNSRTLTYSYDAQKRLTGVEFQFIQPASDPILSTTTYTAWDALGRPVASSGSDRSCTLGTITYDDAARTATYASDPSCRRVVISHVTYDAAGNRVGDVNLINGEVSSSTMTIVTATAAVCL
jgi:hypothetical protein